LDIFVFYAVIPFVIEKFLLSEYMHRKETGMVRKNPESGPGIPEIIAVTVAITHCKTGCLVRFF
jgi:hypothetical protein